MQLSDLTAYAEEKYHIKEQHKWSDFPGFSVLSDPDTGKWVALLMRQWDSEIGEEVERCDIKCGREDITESYITLPFRMHGPKWTGVEFKSDTDPNVVFKLLDKAISSNKQSSFTIVLESGGSKSEPLYIQPAPRQSDQGTGAFSAGHQNASANSQGIVAGYNNISAGHQNASANYNNISAGSQNVFSNFGEQVPDKIQDMIKLYDYGDGSFRQKCRNFYVQGLFMKDYEDNAPWYGDIRRYFPTYHDLNLKQLRGYFTWRAKIRRGQFIKTCSTFVYIYIYELLCGIGASSVQDRLEKLKQFQAGYIDTGMGDMFIKRDLRRWMMELCVINGFSKEIIETYLEPGIMAKDSALSVLRRPETYSDNEVFDALMRFSGPKTNASPVIMAAGEKGKQLFADIWRICSGSHIHYGDNATEGKDLFEVCFGELASQPWHPLANAVYYEEAPAEDRTIGLDECRKFICQNGVWKEIRFDGISADRNAFLSFMHAADLRLRRKLKTGHYLREKKDEAWAYACIDTALAEIRRAEIEAARPKISINVSGLDKIREDADITRESLLTEDEAAGSEAIETAYEAAGSENIETACEAASSEAEERLSSITTSEGVISDTGETIETAYEAAGSQAEESEHAECQHDFDGLDRAQHDILRALLAGDDPSAFMRKNHLMPSIVADSINEALFDDIGDSVIECDGDRLELVEDYVEDIELLIGGDR